MPSGMQPTWRNSHANERVRGRRPTTAAQLGQWLEVSERTLYRDNDGRDSKRCVHPLGLFFWGGA